MPSRFQETFETRLRPTQARAFGVSVQLRRGGQIVTEAFTAVFRDQTHEVEDRPGVYSRIKLREYAFAKAACVFGEDLVEPESGDEILHGDEIYMVSSHGGLTAVEEPIGDYRWLVRTIRVKKSG